MPDDLDRSIQESIEANPGYAALLAESRAELALGLAIAERRQALGWTQRMLAERAGMPQSVIARYEKAGRTPTAPILWRLAAALGVDIVLGPDYTVTLLDRDQHRASEYDRPAMNNGENGSIPAGQPATAQIVTR